MPRGVLPLLAAAVLVLAGGVAVLLLDAGDAAPTGQPPAASPSPTAPDTGLARPSPTELPTVAEPDVTGPQTPATPTTPAFPDADVTGPQPTPPPSPTFPGARAEPEPTAPPTVGERGRQLALDDMPETGGGASGVVPAAALLAAGAVLWRRARRPAR